MKSKLKGELKSIPTTYFAKDPELRLNLQEAEERVFDALEYFVDADHGSHHVQRFAVSEPTMLRLAMRLLEETDVFAHHDLAAIEDHIRMEYRRGARLKQARGKKVPALGKPDYSFDGPTRQKGQAK